MSKLEEFYIENRQVLLKRLYYRAGNTHNAEDVLQEAFCRALKYYSDDVEEIGAWFNTIMNNALVDFKREENSKGTKVDLEDVDEPSYKETELEQDLVKAISERIEAKDKDSRAILHLYFEKEYKPREIRQVLNLSYNSIASIIYRFKVEMNEEFGELFQ